MKQKQRVPKGKKYWYINTNAAITMMWVDWDMEGRYPPIDTTRFESGNYFHTLAEAESMASELRAVLAGADVIEMPSESEFDEYLNSHFPYQGGTKGLICETTKGEWKMCYHYLKSKIVK